MTTPNLFLRTGFIISITLFLPLYLAVVLFTDYSLTGFWTDVILSILISISSLWLVFRKNNISRWLKIILRSIAVLCAFIVFGLIAINLTNPFIVDLFKLRSFYFQKVNGRLFHAYFKPVGAYSGGQGNFWITESAVYFPLIEKRVYYEHGVRHDFSDDYWEGEPIDNYEVVRSYIKDEVIEKGK
jgi:predicted PurR-regulated permease PerM